MGIRRDIEYAVYSHGVWKTRFRDFLSGRAAMDLSVVGEPHACKLGHWLDNEARRMLSPEDHAEACRLHTHFHRIAGNVMECIKRKDYGTARQLLAAAGDFDQASREMAAFLRKMPLRAKAGTGASPPAAERSAAMA